MANVLPTVGGSSASKTSKQIRDHESYMRHREKRRAKQKEYYQANRVAADARKLEWQRTNKEKCNERNRECRRRLRLEVLEAYGAVCNCCGEQQEAFLEVHHVDGGGNQHRRELGGNAKLYSWLKRNGWPEKFGLLCSNCNKAEYNRGICPHRLQKLEGIVN